MPAGERHSGLLLELADRRGGVVGVVCVDGTAGEDPGPAHEALLGVALHQQHLRTLLGVAQHDDRSGLARLGHRALVELLAGMGTIHPHRRRLALRCPARMSVETVQQWICTSCGFIYDPDEGDPDGGIPPGTPFTEIPDDWFCPVCGARKKDFEPYEG
jgi:rubredoxin